MEAFLFDLKHSRYRSRCRACNTDIERLRRQANPEKVRESNARACRRYRDKHPEKVREIAKLHRIANRERLSEKDRAYAVKNRARITKRTLAYRNANPQVKLGARLRTSICVAIRKQGTTKAAKSETLLGCSVAEFRAHIESLWKDGMNWGNYGVWQLGQPMTWHIDHIIPVSSFNLTDPEQQRRCFHWSNMRPMWAFDNLSKQDTMPNGSLGRWSRTGPDENLA